MTAKPSELPGLRVCIRDFGSGPCLATESKGATIVLMVQRNGSLVSCNEDGLLTKEAALPILDRICQLWNDDIERAKRGGKA